MNLKDIQSSLPVNQNDFVFNPTPTICSEAQQLINEDYVESYQFNNMPNDEQGIFTNVGIGNMNMTRINSNLAGGN